MHTFWYVNMSNNVTAGYERLFDKMRFWDFSYNITCLKRHNFTKHLDMQKLKPNYFGLQKNTTLLGSPMVLTYIDYHQNGSPGFTPVNLCTRNHLITNLGCFVSI